MSDYYTTRKGRPICDTIADHSVARPHTHMGLARRDRQLTQHEAFATLACVEPGWEIRAEVGPVEVDGKVLCR